MEISPFTNWILSRILMSPKPRPPRALCRSKPTPSSLIVNLRPSLFESDREVPHTLYLTAFCRAFYRILHRQSETACCLIILNALTGVSDRRVR